jgi:hypothetical protein
MMIEFIQALWLLVILVLVFIDMVLEARMYYDQSLRGFSSED